MAEENRSEEEGKGFKVSDRRLSVRGYEDSEEETDSGDGSEKREADPMEPPPESHPVGESPPAAEPSIPGESDPEPAVEDAGGEPPVPGEAPKEFETLLAILQANAIAAMGLHPQTGERVGGADPRNAKLFVDMIAMVKKKMEGNLTPEEDRLLSQVLSDLQMMYVQQVGLG
ncbi:DUF1844 domain-containing protein [Nitrospinota bacterium]